MNVKSTFTSWICACVLAVAFGHPLRAATYQLSVEPGEGTILLIGSEQQLGEVKKTYFESSRKAQADRKLNCLLLGVLSGTNLQDQADQMKLAYDEYLDRMMKVYADGGATAVFAYEGNMNGGSGKKFAAAAAKHGLKAILQPGDLYFRGANYWDIPAWRKIFKDYKGPEDYTRRYLMPKLQGSARQVRGDRNIFAWQPTEEIAPEDEAIYASYKAAFRRLLPEHLIFQIDSQQTNYEKLKFKKRPYPDIGAFDRYPWWLVPGSVGLWTPHYATRWLFNEVKAYPKAVYDLYRIPAVLILQGCAELAWYDKAAGQQWGWKADANYICPNAPQVRWVPKFSQFAACNRYLAPENAWRLQHWIGIADGYKGMMYWAGGPSGTQAAMDKAWDTAAGATISMIHDDLTVSPHWTEVARSWRELRRYEALILDTHPVDKIDADYAVITQPYVYTGLLRDSAGRNYLVVVNGQIGSWDKTSPEVLNTPRTTLTVDRYGELQNYHPLRAPRTIELKIEGPAATAFDIRTMKKLQGK